jgi:magnesium-transporting ATPase (P-type)
MGQCVPADLRCVDILSIALKLEQAALTGESQSVSKNIN